MKGFIEVTEAKNGVRRMVNVNHIVEIIGNTIYTDNTVHFALDYDYIECVENYGVIKERITHATED